MMPAWAADPTSSQTGADGSMISVTASASITTPYQNQSLDYTVRCIVRGNLVHQQYRCRQRNC
jgi:hypothetical protein